MKKLSTLIILVLMSSLLGLRPPQQEIKLECVKRQLSTRECHYNFLVNGIPHRYIDYGCKGKKDKIVKKAQAGKIALAKEWKIECNPKKSKPE